MVRDASAHLTDDGLLSVANELASIVFHMACRMTAARSRLSLACIAITYVCVHSGSSVVATDELATAVSRYA